MARPRRSGSPGAGARHEYASRPPFMPPDQGLPQPQRTWAILTVFCGLIMAVLDGSIANIALLW